jgi:hypothetical protein
VSLSLRKASSYFVDRVGCLDVRLRRLRAAMFNDFMI